jgi:outer membrane biosynthesis protein TonB
VRRNLGNFGGFATHYPVVRGLSLTLGLSLGAHVLVAALLLGPGLRPPPPLDLVDPSPQLAGETFELPAPETADLPLSNAAPSSETVAAPASDEGDAPARPTPPARGKPAARPSHAGRPSGGRAEPGEADGTGTSETPALYGAVGERSAADLATAFTRGFPQAASADPAWRAAPLGGAGEADVVFTLDESGHIEDMQILGSPSAALSSAIRRTLALVKGRPFVAKGKVTKLHLVASVSSDAVHDGLHGDVFAIGGSFAGGEGTAFFALAIGRRIDVRVRLN